MGNISTAVSKGALVVTERGSWALDSGYADTITVYFATLPGAIVRLILRASQPERPIRLRL